MTEQEFIDYIVDYGTHVHFTFDETDDFIRKSWDLTQYDSAFNANCAKTTSDGRYIDMGFLINNKPATAKECAELFTKHNRNKKLKKLGI